jgi:hypothetical protein
MAKGIALLALSLALEAAFLFQVAVIARPEPRTGSAGASVLAEVVTEADGETVVPAALVASADPRAR